MNERLMRLGDVMAATGLRRSTIYRLAQTGEFPKPIHPLGPRTAAWLESEIEGWIQSRIAACRGGGGDGIRAA